MIKAKTYTDQIIHLTGGIHDYVGELSCTLHPNGEGWYRIKKPCMIFKHKDPQSNAVKTVLSSLQGPKQAYKTYIDIYIPPGESVIEIRILDKSGQLYEVYKKESELKRAKRADGSNLIEMPNVPLVPGPSVH